MKATIQDRGSQHWLRLEAECGEDDAVLDELFDNYDVGFSGSGEGVKHVLIAVEPSQ